MEQIKAKHMIWIDAPRERVRQRITGSLIEIFEVKEAK